MTACLMAGAVALTLAAPAFTLHWTHSVEKVEWREDWRIAAEMLTLTRVAIKGSGAGMEPAGDARLENGWWVWAPMTSLPALTLAASGATGAGWILCSGGKCHELGAAPGEPIRLAPCGG
ncbi:MAG: DUF1850 domain-containing protein [Pseudorhodobacter sp.]